jgi:hypothetical protein
MRVVSVKPIAALYVDPRGVYANLPGVEVWDEARDARRYAGPWPVVAHPPCARWSRWAGFTEARFGYKRGEDGGCFAHALGAVRTWGGVLEHPAYSAAWAAFDLPAPAWVGGWTLGMDGGATCYVEQGRYGHPVKKATWLYAVGVELPELRWGRRLDRESTPGYRWHSPRGERERPELRQSLRAATPPIFRDVLCAMAASA